MAEGAFRRTLCESMPARPMRTYGDRGYIDSRAEARGQAARQERAALAVGAAMAHRTAWEQRTDLAAAEAHAAFDKRVRRVRSEEVLFRKQWALSTLYAAEYGGYAQEMETGTLAHRRQHAALAQTLRSVALECKDFQTAACKARPHPNRFLS